MSPTAAWAVMIIGFALPLLHVALAPGLDRPPAADGARCPFSPRTGWVVVVLFLGPIGWLMFVLSRRRGTR